MKKLLLVCAVAALALPALAKSGALSLIPNDAVTVGVVRLADMRSSPLSSTLFEQTDKVSTNGDAEKFLREAVTGVLLAPAGAATQVELRLVRKLRGLARFGGVQMRRAARRELDEALDHLDQALGA